MLEIIRDTEFGKLKHVNHAFFTRKGGISKGLYNSLNCNDTSADDPENVKENRRRALKQLNVPLESMITVKMVHGNKVIVVDESWDNENRPEADAMVTRQKNVVLASDSADCPIVLFADEHAEIIGLTHAGWRSAKSDIIEKTVEEMILLGAKKNNIFAIIGPCIIKNSYEVSSEFHQQFLLDSSDNLIYFSPSKNHGHFMFDLLQFVGDKLNKLTLKSVTAIGLDTYMNEELFFSCRRAHHRGDSDFGGHLSCVYFNQ